MALTVGTGPFGHRPAGSFNFELPRRKGLIYFEDSPRRMRAIFAGETIVDSARSGGARSRSGGARKGGARSGGARKSGARSGSRSS